MERTCLKLILPGLFLCLITSCDQVSLPVTPSESPVVDGIEQVSAGVKLENPYTVESMKRAHDSLVTRGVLAKGTIGADDLQPTHHYIRFKPQTIEEYTALESTAGLVLWDYPLDYRFPEGMARYCDPEIPKGKPNYLYTAVKIGQELPSKNYEILADLILAPETGENALAKSTAIYSYYDLLEREALRITGNLPDSKQGLAKTTSWYPKGKILIADNTLKKSDIPLVHVNVRTRNWFKWWDGYTDINGNFSCPKDYLGDISYSLRWQYPGNIFDVRDGRAGQAFYDGPSQSSSDWNLVISSGFSWFWAQIFRAAVFYVAQEPFGLNDKPFNVISFQALDENATSTEQGAYSPENENIEIRRYSKLGKPLTPVELFKTVSHELGHAHHDQIYDGAFGPSVDSKLTEAWACLTGYYMTSCVYSLPLETRQLTDYTQQYWEIGGNAYNPFMIDIVDKFNQRSIWGPLKPQDFISGYTLRQLETAISHGGCKTLNDFANEIKALPLPLGITNTMLNDYFNQYNGISHPTYNATTISGTYGFTQGNYIYSPNRRFFLVWQSDGNLVLYDTQVSPWRDVWTSKTWGRVTTQCTMQADGNLVIYNRNKPAGQDNVWCTGTWGWPNAKLCIEDNGRVVIYDAGRTKELWSSTGDTSLRY